MINNKTRAEGSICEASLIQEVGYFACYYFDPDIQSRRIRSKQNEFHIEDFIYQNPHTRSVFNQLARLASKCTTKYLNYVEFNAAKLHVLINCDEVKDFIR
ncbi:hypothetical protein CDL12_21956 [Handroanthus impetiginosus]|uniref:DUF4218 domain-containing protein n=1 Tax=Handroanthus impetiginosus TaxID=429701 RepID=A0A2G9GJP5_9LAMI|nr:hypothetical protein CDL12_21956 [Handroanthus impetiginosus]